MCSPMSRLRGPTSRRARHRHAQDSGHRRGGEGQFRASGHAHGGGPHGPCALDAASQVRSRRSPTGPTATASSSARATGRCCCTGCCTWPATAWASRNWRPSGSGAAARRAIPSTATRPEWRPPPVHWGPASPTGWAWPSPRPSWRPRSTGPGYRCGRPPHLRARQRRRPHGGRQLGGRLAGRPSRPWQAGLSSTTTTTSPSRAAPVWPSPRTWASASRRMGGRCCLWPTARTSTAIDEAHRRGPSGDGPTVAHQDPHGHRLRQPQQGRHRRLPRLAAG